MTKIKEEFKNQQLQKAKEYAISRGGECLSTEYITAKTKLEWKCGNPNHPAWKTVIQITNNGVWCTQCGIEANAKRNKLSNGLQKAQEYAISRGGECLSTEYESVKTKLKWKCHNKSHLEWESDYEHVVTRKHWCRKCSDDKALEKGFDILAEEYAKSKGGYATLPKDRKVKSATKIKWKCKNKKHKEWFATYRNVAQQGGWCPYCAGRFSKEEYLNKAHEYAKSINEKCLTNKYENQNTKLKFKCKNPTHKEWSSTYDRLIEYNRICKECRYEQEQPLRDEYLKKAKEHAHSKNGKCLSTEYKTNNIKLLWQCEKNHKPWYATYQNVVGSLKRWCPECAGQLEPEQWIKKAHEYATNHNGKFISNSFTKKTDHYIWKCSDLNHPEWKTSMSNIFNQNTWCPECGNSIYYKENNTRKILEYLLDLTLKKARPLWNMNPNTNHALELDGYNKEKKIAFEFQGRHHFDENVFKNTSLKDVQKKDRIKKENCEKNKIKLIIIEDDKKIRTPQKLIMHITNSLEMQKINFKLDFDMDEILEIIKVKENAKGDYLKKAKEYAIRRGGLCLSNSYKNYKSHLEWKCHNPSHQSWGASISIASNNHWCPECAGKKRK